MIQVTGKLTIRDGKRDEFILRSKPSILIARSVVACIDFSVSPDPIDQSRVNIYEEWSSRAALDEFRGNGPSDDLFKLVERFDVKEREIA